MFKGRETRVKLFNLQFALEMSESEVRGWKVSDSIYTFSRSQPFLLLVVTYPLLNLVSYISLLSWTYCSQVDSSLTSPLISLYFFIYFPYIYYKTGQTLLVFENGVHHSQIYKKRQTHRHILQVVYYRYL